MKFNRGVLLPGFFRGGMLKKTFDTIDKVFAQIEDWSLFASVCVALVVAMANVVLRKLTSEVNLYWSDEIVRKTIFFST